jgi:hypothetical protein
MIFKLNFCTIDKRIIEWLCGIEWKNLIRAAAIAASVLRIIVLFFFTKFERALKN